MNVDPFDEDRLNGKMGNGIQKANKFNRIAPDKENMLDDLQNIAGV